MSSDLPDISNLRFANVFTTPLITHTWGAAEDINPLLRESILAHEARSASVSKSNQGGWHSEVGQLEFCGDAGRRILQYVRMLTDEATRRVIEDHALDMRNIQWTVHAWANVNRSGAFNKMHVHPGSTWSGTYYVDPGDSSDPLNGAALHLWDPCPGRSTAFLHVPASIYINPKPGLMVLFPSYLPHMVFPNMGVSTRISIAFNLRKEPFP